MDKIKWIVQTPSFKAMWVLTLFDGVALVIFRISLYEINPDPPKRKFQVGVSSIGRLQHSRSFLENVEEP